MTEKILSIDQTVSGLKYITESPDEEHGGFNETTILIARSAVHHFSEMYAAKEIEDWFVTTSEPERIGVMAAFKDFVTTERKKKG